jgi:Pyruvate/2-oxoacid:ferredoxin oxidoreductase gamma subunit
MDANWQDIIKAYLPEKLHELNIKAFREGIKQV